MYQHAVAQREPIVDIRLGEGEIDGQVEVPCAWAIDADRQDVKDLVRRQLGEKRGRRDLPGAARVPVAQLGGPGQKEIAPGRTLRAVGSCSRVSA